MQGTRQIRFEWGIDGLRACSAQSDTVVIVDVLSFTTSVDIAVSRGAMVYPYRSKDESAVGFAQQVGAVLAGKRGEGLSLSPASLLSIEPQTHIVLPSPNGSTCTVEARQAGCTVVAGCLRNAEAVARRLRDEPRGEVLSVIACGEHWGNGQLRPAMEDLLGAGAILSGLEDAFMTPEARMAVGAFRALESDLYNAIAASASGLELFERGFERDVALAAELNASEVVPILHAGAYISWAKEG